MGKTKQIHDHLFFRFAARLKTAIVCPSAFTDRLFMLAVSQRKSNCYQQNIPLPYDFDMTGWVNPSYATVNTTLGINSVQDRKYRGFKREQKYFDEVRQQFLNQKMELFRIVASYESEFTDPKEYQNMFEFMESFYEVMEDKVKFQKSIVDSSRTK